MQQITTNGGLIALSYWAAAVCATCVNEVANAVKYGIELAWSEHVALGSDYDDATNEPFDTSELVYLNQALLDLGVSELDIKQVMGANMLQYLKLYLPD